MRYRSETARRYIRDMESDGNPDYRFRLAAIETWEQANEETIGEQERPASQVRTGAPPGLEGCNFFGGKPRKGRGLST
jgi:hypothetical protein